MRYLPSPFIIVGISMPFTVLKVASVSIMERLTARPAFDILLRVTVEACGRGR